MFCQVNGIRLYYEVSGEGPALIMVHGNTESHAIFDVALRDLSPHYRVYTVDSRCHGSSTKNVPLSYDLMAEDMIQFIWAMDLKEPAFYGFSDGGIIGLKIALAEPELLGKLIVSGANLNPGGLKASVLLTYRLFSLSGDPMYKMVVTEPRIPVSDLKAIRVPTVVLAGTKDMVRTAHTMEIAAAIPGALLELLPGETHGSYIVHSEKLGPLLQKYL